MKTRNLTILEEIGGYFTSLFINRIQLRFLSHNSKSCEKNISEEIAKANEDLDKTPEKFFEYSKVFSIFYIKKKFSI